MTTSTSRVVVVLVLTLLLCDLGKVSAKLGIINPQRINDDIDNEKTAFQGTLAATTTTTTRTGDKLFQGEQNVEMVEVIIGMNVQEDESTFAAMSATFNPLSESVKMESLIPQIKSGVARIPVQVSLLVRYTHNRNVSAIPNKRKDS